MMKKHKKIKNADQLTSLLKPELLDTPSVAFSDKLLHASITSYRMSYSTKYKKEERLGKMIMLVLLFFNLMMLYILNPFAMHHTVLLSLLALVVGVGFLLWVRINNSLFQAKSYIMHANLDRQ